MIVDSTKMALRLISLATEDGINQSAHSSTHDLYTRIKYGILNLVVYANTITATVMLLPPFPQVYQSIYGVNVLLFDMYKEWNWEINIFYQKPY